MREIIKSVKNYLSFIYNLEQASVDNDQKAIKHGQWMGDLLNTICSFILCVYQSGHVVRAISMFIGGRKQLRELSLFYHLGFFFFFSIFTKNTE